MPAAAENSARFTRPHPGPPPDSEALAVLPMAGPHAPAVTCAHPRMADPVIARSAGYPATVDPHVAAAHPVPISAHPHIARVRCNADNFDSRLRRCDHDNAPGIVTLIGDHHACGKRHCDDETDHSGCEHRLALVHDLFLLSGNIGKLTSLVPRR